jgi:hypothetical protein
LSVALNNLVHEIRDLTPSKLIADGYLTKNQAVYYFGKKDFDSPFRFDYLAVSAGTDLQAHYHIMFFGEFIPREWICDAWQRLLGVDWMTEQTVDIRECSKEKYDNIKLARYCVRQYVADQSDYNSFHCSNGWIYPGFCKDFMMLEYQYKHYGCFNAETFLWKENGYFPLTLDSLIGDFINRKAFHQNSLEVSF